MQAPPESPKSFWQAVTAVPAERVMRQPLAFGSRVVHATQLRAMNTEGSSVRIFSVLVKLAHSSYPRSASKDRRRDIDR